MTKEEIQEEAGILALACAQLGNELAARRLGVAADVHDMLGVIVRKRARLLELEQAAQKAKGDNVVNLNRDVT